MWWLVQVHKLLDRPLSKGFFKMKTFLYIVLLLLTGVVSARADGLMFGDGFGAREDSLAAVLISETAGGDSAAVYRGLGDQEKAAYLQSFWQARNPLFGRLYYGYHLGYRYLTVSDAFFERGDLIPLRYKFQAIALDVDLVNETVALCVRILADASDDLVAQCALGYGILEQGKGVEAERIFLKVIQKDKHFLAARHGRALACLIQHKRVRRALDYFRETVSLDSEYEAAVYNSALCHLAMRSVDMDHQFGMVVKRFPRHYDAYYKLGVFYETLRYYTKAIEAYSKQVAVNPAHGVARGKLARVALEMRYLNQQVHTTTQLRDLADKDPKRYLPLLAAQHLAEKEYEASETAYRQYLSLLSREERAYYDDVSFLTTPEEQQAFQWSQGIEKQNLLAWFWRKKDPTPTTPVNERQLEHIRRVYYARQNFAEGKQPWDQRGEVYIRFGHPDHRSWSDHLVFETDKHVVKVKNRLTNLAFDAIDEVVPTGFYQGAEAFGTNMFRAEMAEVRGFPIFPLPHQGSLFRDGASLNSKWESWIYGHIGEGFEVTFHDALGDYDYQFPLPPAMSPNYRLWQYLAPETVVGRAVKRSPSVYQYQYGADPLPLYLSTADFKGAETETALDVYLGVPWQELNVQKQGEMLVARLDRTLVLFDSTGTEVFRDTLNAEATTSDTRLEGLLWVDQAQFSLAPGSYFLAARVTDPSSGRLQIFRQDVEVEAYLSPTLMVSDLEVAGKIVELDKNEVGKFVRGDVEVVPLPSRTFAPEQAVYLYYEVYNLFRDDVGQTRYKVDYAVRGVSEKAGARLLRGIGKLLGITRDDEGVKISYEHQGTSEKESVYIALDLGATGGQRMEISVTVTDLVRAGKPKQIKSVTVVIGDKQSAASR